MSQQWPHLQSIIPSITNQPFDDDPCHSPMMTMDTIQLFSMPSTLHPIDLKIELVLLKILQLLLNKVHLITVCRGCIVVSPQSIGAAVVYVGWLGGEKIPGPLIDDKVLLYVK